VATLPVKLRLGPITTLAGLQAALNDIQLFGNQLADYLQVAIGAGGFIAVGANPPSSGMIRVDASAEPGNVVLFASSGTGFRGTLELAPANGGEWRMRNANALFLAFRGTATLATIYPEVAQIAIGSGATSGQLADPTIGRQMLAWYPKVQVGDGATGADAPFTVDFGALGASVPSLRLNGLTDMSGAVVLNVITNGPTGVAQNPRKWVTVSLDGTVYYWSLW
jgi:hypothetical protein